MVKEQKSRDAFKRTVKDQWYYVYKIYSSQTLFMGKICTVKKINQSIKRRKEDFSDLHCNSVLFNSGAIKMYGLP